MSRNTIHSLILSASCGAVAIAMLGAAAPVLAADAASAAAGDAPADALTEIVVTAQKRPENLQKVPIAISSLSGAALQDRHAQSLLDLGDGAIPSLRVDPFFSRPSALIINIRGIGVLSDSNQPARDQGVGIYVDGVYLGRPQGLGTALFDVENLEVLKGPQGTLFGRNTEGGAVSITTKKPSGKFKMNTTIGAGNYGSYKGETHIDLPEFANISFKVDAIVSKRDAFVSNPYPGASGFNSYDKRGIHGEALWKPMSNFSADLSLDTSYDATTTLYQQQVSAPVGLTGPATTAVTANVLAAINPLQPSRASTAVVGVPEQPGIGKSTGGRLTLEWNVMPKLKLKSISAYRELTQSQFDNGSAAPALQAPASLANAPAGFATSTPSTNVFTNPVPGFAFGRYSLAYFRQNQVSQELQAIGEFDRVKYQAGALFYQEKVEDNAVAYNTAELTGVTGNAVVYPTPAAAAQVYQRASHVTTTSIGVYGQATYTPPIANDIAHLTLGGRWTNDKKVGQLFIVNGAAPIVPVNGVNVQAPVNLNYSASRVDPLINLGIDATRDVHLYGKWSTGYRSGGANSRSVSYSKFSSETISMFEIGAKTEFLNHRARFNVAAFTAAYKNIQVDFSGAYIDFTVNPPIFTTRTTTDTINAPGTGRVKGVEAEFTVAPVKGLTLNLSYAYNSVNIPATLNPFPIPNSGGKFITVPVPIYQVETPEHAASGSVDYEMPINNFKMRVHLDGNYNSGYYANATDSNYDSATRAVTYAQPKGDAAFIVNGRLALTDITLGSTGGKLTVAVWARNLLNEQHLFYKSGSAATGVSGFFNDFRTFGGEINIKF
jgi:iron complex outermembrane receptor protein